MFKFGKKNAEVTETFLEEVTDEQLSQVSGGSLTNVVNQQDPTLDSVSNVPNLGTQALGSISVSGLQVKAAGISVSTPAIVPGTLLP